MLNAAVKSRGLPHVIVVGNEKGGSGKTTIAMHIAVALMKSGQRVDTIDLDSRQRTLTHYIENRRAWARRCHVDLELPTHLTVAYAEGARVDENDAAEFADFGRAVLGEPRLGQHRQIPTSPCPRATTAMRNVLKALPVSL